MHGWGINAEHKAICFTGEPASQSTQNIWTYGGKLDLVQFHRQLVDADIDKVVSADSDPTAAGVVSGS